MGNGSRGIEVTAAIREQILGDIDDPKMQGDDIGQLSPDARRPGPLQDGAHAFGIREDVELLDPDADPLYPGIG